MPITFEDVFDVSAEEEFGFVVALQRRGRVFGLTSTNPTAYVSEIVSSGVLPQSGSAILVNGSTLYLGRRNITVNDDSALGDATVDLFYRRLEGGTSETGTTPTLRGGTTLKQIQTQKDRDGNPIYVSHLWPATSHELYPDGTPKANTTERAIATINALVPMSSISGRLIVATNTPGAITQDYAGKVNSSTWQGGAERTWLCTSATFELVDNTTSPKLYALDFVFEYDDQTWDNDTTAVFINPDTGQVPEVEDVPLPNGKEVVQVQYYQTKNFNEDF
jgi:hypothetical protein